VKGNGYIIIMALQRVLIFSCDTKCVVCRPLRREWLK